MADKKIKIKTVEEMWETYLSLSKIKRVNMAPGQYVEMRKTFYGAIGMILAEQLVIADLTKDKGAEQMEKWWQETRSFWHNQLMNHN